MPLPALQPDAVVEYEIVVAEKQPLFQEGNAWREYFTARSPTGLIRLILEAPNALPLRHVVHGLTTPMRRTQNSSTTRLVFERGDELMAEVKAFAEHERLRAAEFTGIGAVSSAKLAAYLSKQGRAPLLIASDLQRPAAIEQLATLAK